MALKQNPAMVAEMDRLLDDYNYADVARILNDDVSSRQSQKEGPAALASAGVPRPAAMR